LPSSASSPQTHTSEASDHAAASGDAIGKQARAKRRACSRPGRYLRRPPAALDAGAPSAGVSGARLEGRPRARVRRALAKPKKNGGHHQNWQCPPGWTSDRLPSTHGSSGRKQPDAGPTKCNGRAEASWAAGSARDRANPRGTVRVAPPPPGRASTNLQLRSRGRVSAPANRPAGFDVTVGVTAVPALAPARSDAGGVRAAACRPSRACRLPPTPW